MKRYLILLFLLFSLTINAQVIHNYSYVIDMHYYKAYYSKTIKASSFVIYKLYKGGGNVDRSLYTFKGYRDLPYFSYAKTGYDRGHLVPAEDFADEANKMRSTFYYINCIPQTTKLNRGSWKKYETQIRKLSQSDSLLVICGGCDYPRGGSENNRLVPKNCFKIVYDLKTKKCIYSLLFKNDDKAKVENCDILKQKISFRKAMNLYSKKRTY